MPKLDGLDKLFIAWAFFFQVVLILHFAVRRILFESYTVRYGWIVYALCIPAVVVSILLLRNGKNWSFWIGGFIFLLFSAFGYYIDYVLKLQFRSPFRAQVGIPYVALYLGTMMFYWWPLGAFGRPLWIAYGVLFVIGTMLNITSH